MSDWWELINVTVFSWLVHDQGYSVKLHTKATHSFLLKSLFASDVRGNIHMTTTKQKNKNKRL